MKKTSYSLEGYEQIVKVVKATGNSGRVYVPASWVGCEVAIIRLSNVDGVNELSSVAGATRELD